MKLFKEEVSCRIELFSGFIVRHFIHKYIVTVWRTTHGSVFRTMLDQHSMAADDQCFQGSSREPTPYAYE